LLSVSRRLAEVIVACSPTVRVAKYTKKHTMTRVERERERLAIKKVSGQKEEEAANCVAKESLK